MHRRKLFLPSLATTAILLAGAQATAETSGWTTTGGEPACQQPHWLEAALHYRDDGNERSYERYIDTGRCVEPSAGMSVELRNEYGDGVNNRVEFILKGYRFFAHRDAISNAL